MNEQWADQCLIAIATFLLTFIVLSNPAAAILAAGAVFSLCVVKRNLIPSRKIDYPAARTASMLMKSTINHQHTRCLGQKS